MSTMPHGRFNFDADLGHFLDPVFEGSLSLSGMGHFYYLCLYTLTITSQIACQKFEEYFHTVYNISKFALDPNNNVPNIMIQNTTKGKASCL